MSVVLPRSDGQRRLRHDRRKQRIKQAAAVGLLIPALAIGGAVLTGDSPETRWIGEALVWVIAWPMYLFKSLYPDSEDASRTARIVRLTLDLSTPLVMFLTYFSCSYAALRWRARQKQD